MKKTILIAIVIMATAFTATAQSKKEASKVKNLTYKEFLNKVWNFESDPNTFVYKGKLPAVIDFYADWCGPCRRVAPIMEKLAEEYDGRLLVYKVNVDQEKKLSELFNIRSIPAVMFIPAASSSSRGVSDNSAQPMMQVGAMPEEGYRQVIEEKLLK
jgi:Thioredoxin domain-containing protein